MVASASAARGAQQMQSIQLYYELVYVAQLTAMMRQSEYHTHPSDTIQAPTMI